MANSNLDSDVPHQFANITPPDVSVGAGQIRLVVKPLEEHIREIKDDIKDIKEHRHSDFMITMSIFATGFLLLAGMLIFGYFRLDDKLDTKTKELVDKTDAMELTTTKIDTKLDDLLQRIPPVQNQLPGSTRK